MTAPADWFLRTGAMAEVMSDPEKVARRLLAALPADARAAIIGFAEFGLTGSVTLNFNEGKISACEERSHHRVGAA